MTRTCSDCIHCQMCRWLDDMVKNSTCDFFKDWKVIRLNKRFCDRCGNEIVETKKSALKAFCDAVETMKVKFGGKHRIKYRVEVIDIDDPKIPYPVADLCEQCKQELKKFMNCTLKAKDVKEVKNDTK